MHGFPQMIPMVCAAAFAVVLLSCGSPQSGSGEDEVYAGYWGLPGYTCRGSGLARLGIDGGRAELTPGLESDVVIEGTLHPDGRLEFEDRMPLSPCERCSEPPVLQTSGVLDTRDGTGEIGFEVTCLNVVSVYRTETTTIELAAGDSPNDPLDEMERLASKIRNRTRAANRCTADSECRLLIPSRYDTCGFNSFPYSATYADEDELIELSDEYRHNHRLAGLDRGIPNACPFRGRMMCDDGQCRLEYE